MHDLPDSSLTAAAAVGWFYLVTNATRVFTYLPQIAAVWRSKDGARAISLFTWGSWLVSHIAAILYGVLVAHDRFFVLIALINFCGCGCVTLIAARRRLQWRQRQRVQHSVRTPANAAHAAASHARRATLASWLRAPKDRTSRCLHCHHQSLRATKDEPAALYFSATSSVASGASNAARQV